MISYTRMRLSPVLRTRDHPPLTYVLYCILYIYINIVALQISVILWGVGGGKWEGYFFTLGGG